MQDECIAANFKGPMKKEWDIAKRVSRMNEHLLNNKVDHLDSQGRAQVRKGGSMLLVEQLITSRRK